MSDFYEINCPYCNIKIIIQKNELNCMIFRCGTLKNGEQINPHLPKIQCDQLFNNNQIIGCAKPFKFDGQNLLKCDYI